MEGRPACVDDSYARSNEDCRECRRHRGAFTLLREQDMFDERFAADTAWVERALQGLKTLDRITSLTQPSASDNEARDYVRVQ